MEGQTVPHLLFMAFQMMFAIITPALISGAYAERLKFSAYVLFTLLWSTLIYDPVAHWVWGPGGWLAKRGAVDFAGGIVVHVTAGVSALVVALMVGKRHGFPREKSVPHNLTMTVLGAGLLWFGWFGFNAGSALGAGLGTFGHATLALVNTHVAAGAGALAWCVIEMIRFKKTTAFGFVSGLIGGLATITPAVGYVSPMSAVLIGLAGGAVCYGGVLMKGRFNYDDTLDAFGVHGVGGVLGSLLTGACASKLWNPKGIDGALVSGTFQPLIDQGVAIGAVAAFSAVGTAVILKVLDITVGLRVSQEEEFEGLDSSLHDEQGYAMGEFQAHALEVPPARESEPRAASLSQRPVVG